MPRQSLSRLPSGTLDAALRSTASPLASQGRGAGGGPWPAAVAQARAELLLGEDDPRAAADALRRAAEGYAAAGQLLNERRAREALARLHAARISA